MLANEIEGATSGERLGDLERLGDHLTSRHGVALLAGRGNKAAVYITKLPTCTLHV